MSLLRALVIQENARSLAEILEDIRVRRAADDAPSAGGSAPFAASTQSAASPMALSSAPAPVFGFTGPIGESLLSIFLGEAPANGAPSGAAPSGFRDAISDFVYGARAGEGDLEGEIAGGEDDDALVGTQASEGVIGAQGDDRLVGGGGDDFLNGGVGADTAVFTGASDEYEFDVRGGNLFVRDTVAGRDGEDELYAVESAEFSDGVFSVSELANADLTPPTAPPAQPTPPPAPSAPGPAPSGPSAPPSADAAEMAARYAEDIARPERPVGSGVELWVGEGHPYKTLQEAIDASSEGDTIYVESQMFVNEVAKVKHSLSIIGVGDEPVHMIWDRTQTDNRNGSVDGGKGLLEVTKDVELFYIENFKFTGATSYAKNGSGIRANGQEMYVVDSVFEGNEIGILAGNLPGAELYVHGSTFENNGGEFYPPGHSIYFTNQKNSDQGKLVIVDTEIRGTLFGQHIQSVADETVIVNTLIDDNGNDNASAINISGGGDVFISGVTLIDLNGRNIEYFWQRGAETSAQVVIDNTTVVTSHNGRLFRHNTGETPVISNTVVQTTDPDVKFVPFEGFQDHNTSFAIVENFVVDGQEPVSFGPTAGFSPNSNGDDYVVDVREGTDGADTISVINDVDAANTILFGGEGDDTLFSSGPNPSETYLVGGGGNDVLVGVAKAVTLAGGAGDDILITTSDADDILPRFFGAEGDDLIFSGVGKEHIDTGTGDDVIHLNGAGSFKQVIDAGAGYDIVIVRTDFATNSIDVVGDYVRIYDGDYNPVQMRKVEVVQFDDGVLYVETETFVAGDSVVDVEALETIRDDILAQFYEASTSGGGTQAASIAPIEALGDAFDFEALDPADGGPEGDAVWRGAPSAVQPVLGPSPFAEIGAAFAAAESETPYEEQLASVLDYAERALTHSEV